ncbi:hypothetical protein IHE55_30290, partial [Streptomyces pactum]|nr:hypothetical protein [Streptomyces pactum]
PAPGWHTDPLPHPGGTRLAAPDGWTPRALPPRAPPPVPAGGAQLLPVLRI